MADNLTPEQRQRNMANIRSRHTKPELVVRSIVHKLGYRFRLHYKKLVGKPDLVLPRHKKIILIHGCFWHVHTCRRGSVTPKTNLEYWKNKRLGNVERDEVNIKNYATAGFQTLVIWECELRHPAQLTERIADFMSSGNRQANHRNQV
ncbi:MAG: very short patch repair endonuclease [Pyrinomonadaceae bacterium]